MPRALDTTAMWLIVLMFTAGAALSVVLYGVVARLRRGRPQASTGAWMVLLSNRTYDTESNNRMQSLRREVHDHVSESADMGAPRSGAGYGGLE